MYKNNFDNSSTGVNIEFYGCYDTYESQDLFENNFKRLKDDVFFYSQWTEGEVPEQIVDLFRILPTVKKSELESLVWYNGESRAELVQDILERPIKEYQDFLEVLTLRANYERLTTRGYSQGDICTVYFKKKHPITPTQADHLFWDSPIAARLTINNHDIFYTEYFDPYEEFDPDAFAKIAAEKSGVDAATIRAIMPDSLDWS